MSSPLSRRDFVATTAKVSALAGVGNFAFLNALPHLSADDTRVRPEMVRTSADIEPLVRVLEETPRDEVLERVALRIRRGTSYQELLSALMLAGVRGIQPRPVGFKFHAVLVVNSAHLAAQAAGDRDRWLPLFWAVDNFKGSQARNQQEGNWHMARVDEARLPSALQARQRFTEAMDNWDEEGADRAIVSLVRSGGANEVIELFWRYGARDYRAIGHKAIYVANAWRTLQTIGWRYAEPILRSLAYALLAHEGENPARREDARDQPGRDNAGRLQRIRDGWQRGRATPEAARDLLADLRGGTPAQVCDRVANNLNREIDPASVWDAVFLRAGELLMQQPGIVGLHVVTTMNALYYAYQTSANDETRRYLMLQAAAFLPLFRQDMGGRGRVQDNLRIDTLQAADVEGAQPIEEIFADASRDRMVAARKTLGLLQGDREQAATLMAAARRLIFSRGTDSHDYKFSSAILEDFQHATPAWRDRFLATGMFYLRGSGGRDTDLYNRIRAALGNA
jgi:hypothetical protein